MGNSQHEDNGARAFLAQAHIETMATLSDERSPEEIERKRLLREDRLEELARRRALVTVAPGHMLRSGSDVGP